MKVKEQALKNLESFKIEVPQETVDDLNDRLAKTRWTDEIENSDWQYGTNKTHLKELCDYWQNSFDWKKRQEYLNSFPQYKVTVDGVGIHFIHLRGRRKFDSTVINTRLHRFLCAIFKDYSFADKSG
jgi:hypothetical protein